MTKRDEQLAQELDAFLTAHLKQRPLPAVDEKVQGEAQLALELFDLAQAQEPDPIFLSDLEAQLAAAASRPTPIKKQPEQAERPFWHNFTQIIKETFTMKRTIYALGGLAAVILIGAFIWFNFNGQGNEPDMVADSGTTITETVDTETAVADSSDTSNGTGDTSDTGDTNVETPATPDTSNLPKLPILGQAGGRGGFGGGGGGGAEVPAADESTIVEGDMMIDPIIWNPLADAQYTVNVPFPTDPTFATVYQQSAENLFTIEDIQRYAQLFGMNGPIYTEVFPEPVYDVAEGEAAPEIPAWTPPTYYYVFDGQRQLSFYETNIYYFDQSVSQNYTVEIMPFEQAAPIAEAFLQERGLLDFPYVAMSPWGGDVQIHRIINGYVNTSAEFYVSVTTNGDIMGVSYQPFNKLETVGDYPLRSAEEAWQEVLNEGFDYMSRYWMTYPGPDFEMPEPGVYEPAPWEELYKYWNRTFNEGNSIVIVSYPLVYLPVNGDTAPRIMVDQYRLTGATEDLQALAEYAGQPVRIEGVVRGEMPAIVIEMTGWQPEPNQEWQYKQGTIRFDGTQVLFDGDEGETFAVPNPPADLTDGERVNLSGWSIERGDGAYRVFNWSSMDRIIDWEAFETDVVEPLPVEPGEEYKITDVTIDEIDLIYQYSPIFEETRGITGFMMQPAWRFKGSTNTNEIIEIVVQAVSNDFVESDGQ